ncbi:hypothetical protein [Roseibacillus persicicus]|uniref:Uncharacterized protein n=1 Tax=Roseibacillus persicicus TaxID=454148 RepID=A0A918TKX9_9BACT|nr:hypothetical protein [Roseibacillus persicicus]MDQ8192168.1 hypothetical protein [Roseibacillus persicicus]GHC52432.1 hypothetical protein GCM10007100_18410 [Roseibacillus persicicus]
MPETKFNPSQQVERIREILVGREMGRIERRLAELETTRPNTTTSFRREPAMDNRLATAQQTLLRDTQELKIRIQKESAARQQQIAQLAQKLSRTNGLPLNQQALEEQISDRMEKVASEMTALIDARTREILHHLQNEILQWKNQMDRDLQSIRDIKADRQDLSSRFARLAAAAMEDDGDFETPEGYLL